VIQNRTLGAGTADVTGPSTVIPTAAQNDPDHSPRYRLLGHEADQVHVHPDHVVGRRRTADLFADLLVGLRGSCAVIAIAQAADRRWVGSFWALRDLFGSGRGQVRLCREVSGEDLI
jgi:hypothetical protein